MIEHITTIEDLAEMIQRTMASKEDLQGVKDDLQDFRAEMTEFKEDMGRFKQDMRQFQQAMAEQFMSLHEDVAYARNATSMVVKSDAAQDKEIDRLKERAHRLEQKAGFAV